MSLFISYEDVRRLFDYDSGRLIWKNPTAIKTKVGSIAGTLLPNGYRDIHIYGKKYREHRVIWLWHHGKWPTDQIDHINGVRDDNRIENLREATRVENYQNKTVYKNNLCGKTGVYFHKQRSKWASSIQINKKRVFLGLFEDVESAYAAYVTAKANLHTFQPFPIGSEERPKVPPSKQR